MLSKFNFLFICLICSSFSIAQPTSWESRGVGGGGSLFRPAISPHNTSDMYIQCDMSEVFHTSNQGASWSEIHFSEIISTGGNHTVEYTSDPNILYTVNLDFLTDEWFPVKSVDGGATWSTITDPTGGGCWYISADPNSTDRLLLASYTQLYFSNDGGANFNMVHDNGGSFYIAGTFWDGTDIYVGTEDGMFVSTNNGTSFSLDGTTGIPAGEGFISFTGSEESGTVQLMGTTAADPDLFPGLKPLDINIYSSIIELEVGNAAWTTVTSGISSNHDLFYISSSLHDNDVFYVGGTDNSTSYPVVYKTTDAGASWTEVFLPVNNQNVITGWSGYNGDEDWWYGEIVFGLDVAPNDPDVLVYTDFGFAHVSADGGTTWRQAYVEQADENTMGVATPIDQSYAGNGLENTSSWQLTWLDQDKIFASYTDITAIRSTDGGNKWAFDFSGISYNTVYDVIQHPSNGTLYAAVSTVHDLYQSTYLQDSQIDGGSGGIMYSTDEGATWTMMQDFGMPVIWLALDPNDANTMYASVVNSSNGGIYKTNDLNNLVSSAWTQTTNPPRTEGHPYNVEVLDDGNIVATFCGRRAPGFTASSGVFMSDDGGTSWSDVSMDDEMHYWTKDICIDPNDATQNTWYVAVHSGWGGAANNKGGLYKTTDRGQNWVQIWDSYRVESATVHPTDPDIIYASTEFEGLWYSSNGTSGTPTFTQVSSYSFQHPMRIVYNPYDVDEIWITSFGNGLKMNNAADTTGGGGSGIEDYSNEQYIYPNPANDNVKISVGGASTVSIYDLSGKQVLNSNLSSSDISLGHLENGMYVVVVELKEGSRLVQKLMIQR